LWPEDEGAVVEAKLKTKQWDHLQARDHVLTGTARVAKAGVRGYVQLVDDLDHFQFPAEVLSRTNISVFLAVAPCRGQDWAQSRYVVCFVLAEKGDIDTGPTAAVPSDAATSGQHAPL
jgi:hypothetical protein